MVYQEKTLVCMECNQEFTFTTEEQAYHAEKGYTNQPKRCPNCRQARRSRSSYGGEGGGMTGPRGKCIQSPAINVVKRTRFRSYPAAIALFTAGTATPASGTRPIAAAAATSRQGNRSFLGVGDL